jgi:hypothetical protein
MPIGALNGRLTPCDVTPAETRQKDWLTSSSKFASVPGSAVSNYHLRSSEG